MWFEEAVWNSDFVELFPNLTVRDLNILERNTLDLLQYNVAVNSSQYAKYYFELRSLSDLSTKQFTLEPIDSDTALKLEVFLRCFKFLND